MKSRSYKNKLKNSKPEKPKAYLFGPFLGELSWEFYRFAPYAIFLKKQNPDTKIIVLTRESRFDLYGKHADILIPLRIKKESSFPQKEFGLDGYKPEYYETIKKYFHQKYSKRFDIIEQFCPLVHGWHRKIRWQFPRDKMDYDFQPKEKYKQLVDGVLKEDDIIIDNEAIGYINLPMFKEINSQDLFLRINLGMTIESIRKCEFVIGNMSSDISHLAILMKKPLISLNEKLSNDSISLLNPHKTPIIRCENIKEGLEIYEDNFRSEKSWSWKQRRFVHFSKVW